MQIDRTLRRIARFLRWPSAALLSFTASAALACSTIVLGLPDRPLVAYSFDFDATGAGFMIVNPKDATRRSIMEDTPAQWPVRHASVTFNQIGPGMPAAGMNTAGLVVTLMWNAKAAYGGNAGAPAVNELEFIQRLLDTAGSVDEALASLDDMRIVGTVPIHYLLADRSGGIAAITPGKSGLQVHTGKAMPHPALTNTSYAALLEEIGAFEGFGGDRAIHTGDGTKDPGSLDRFAVAALATRHAGPMPTAATAFGVLHDVANSETRWQIVFDPSAQRIAFRMAGKAGVHHVDLADLDSRCTDRPLSVDLSQPANRNVSAALAPIDPSVAGPVAAKVLGSFSGGVAFPPDVGNGLIEGLLASTRCTP